MSDLEKRAEEFLQRVVDSSVRGLYVGPDIGLVMFVKALRIEHELGRKEGLKKAYKLADSAMSDGLDEQDIVNSLRALAGKKDDS